MIVVGAKGMAKEVLEILANEMELCNDEIVFFDNVSEDVPDTLFDTYRVLTSFDEAEHFLRTNSPKFVLGLGNPMYREELARQFESIGGQLTTVISSKAHVGSFGTRIGEGSTIMQGVTITSGVSIGKGVLINVNSSISHDSSVGNYAEIACNVVIPGGCFIGQYAFLGGNAVLNPNIQVGEHAVIGAGAVVIKDIPAHTTAVGNPATIIKRHG